MVSYVKLSYLDIAHIQDANDNDNVNDAIASMVSCVCNSVVCKWDPCNLSSDLDASKTG